ncbi:MAG: N-acetylmuramoyl-L-alanine amidase [Patescibacteria group bacterium]
MFKYLVSIFFLLFSLTNFASAHTAGAPYDPFYSKLSSSEHLKQHYSEGDLRILIVPGHGKLTGGTSFGGLYERDLNVIIADKLAKLLETNTNFKIYLARDLSGDYSSWLRAYMETGREAILAFRTNAIKYYNSIKFSLPPSGQSVYHNTASEQAAFELYALNKFANDNRIDIALHIHINDYPRRNMSGPGEHVGFTVYVPDSNFANSQASTDLASFMRDKFSRIIPVSTLPGENMGVTPDRELIAIGSNGSRDSAALLVEYGYIYESQITSANASVRNMYFDLLANETYQAIKSYFGYLPAEQAGQVTESGMSDYIFTRFLKRGMKSEPDVLALQIKLNKLGLYPPIGKTLRDCPITSNFGPCTEQSVKNFQVKNNLEQVGIVGPQTRALLNLK